MAAAEPATDRAVGAAVGGTGGVALSLSAYGQLALTCPLTDWNGQDGLCRWCCKNLPARRSAWCSDRCRRAFDAQHLWRRARARARRRAKRLCSLAGCDSPAGTPIDIDHVVALAGAGYGPSCAHHETNLRALCRPHHQQRTAEQNRHRSA